MADTSCSSNMAERGTPKIYDDAQGRAEVRRSKASSDDSNLARCTVRARGDEEIREETKKPTLKCLNMCSVQVQNMASKLMENDPTFVVTSCQQLERERLQALDTAREDVVLRVADRAVTRTRSIVKKISTEGPFPCGAVEKRRDVEGAVTRVGIEDTQLFVCEVIDKNLEDEYMDEINESADKCHEPENHRNFAWDDVDNCKLDPARVQEARKVDMEYFQKMHVYKKVPVQKSRM